MQGVQISPATRVGMIGEATRTPSFRAAGTRFGVSKADLESLLFDLEVKRRDNVRKVVLIQRPTPLMS
jgi:hypothetical protein